MPLYALDERKQNPICRGEHWRLFPPFQRRPLYDAIIAELDRYVADHYNDGIDSSWAGSEILGTIEAESPQLFDAEDPDQISGLFGMTVWNYLAQHADDWCFVRKAPLTDEPEGTKYFRRR